jgi:retron-type reverse transcriptase
MAADRFQKVIMQCIHKNQYGFIKSRTIHDCLAWTFGYIHQCKASKKPVVILKLDFEKAFDTIEHEVIYEILRKKGFSKEWIAWVRMILESGISSVLINGVPGKQFRCKRGVRQGDPLSPLLFVLGADLLQSVVNDLLQRGLISLPIHTGDPDFPIIQYADDTLLIVPADSVQLSVLKEALQDFSSSTSLKVNFHI